MHVDIQIVLSMHHIQTELCKMLIVHIHWTLVQAKKTVVLSHIYYGSKNFKILSCECCPLNPISSPKRYAKRIFYSPSEISPHVGIVKTELKGWPPHAHIGIMIWKLVPRLPAARLLPQQCGLLFNNHLLLQNLGNSESTSPK